MKMKTKHVAGTMLVPFLIITIFSVAPVHSTPGIHIYVDPASTVNPTLTLGMSYTIAIKTDYSGDDVWGWEFTLTYNASVLRGIEVNNGDLITGPSAMFIPGTFDNVEGKLSLTGNAFFFTSKPAPLTSGPGILATVTFKVVSAGISNITLGPETRLIGLHENGYGDNYNIIDTTMPDRILGGAFDNTGATGTPDVGFDWFDSVDGYPEFVPGEVLVGFRTSISVGLVNGTVTTGIESIDELNEQFQVKEITKVLSGIYKLTLPKDADVLSAMREYEADPNVEYAEPNGIGRYFAVPDDAEYWRQWTHEVTQAELAWNKTTGNSTVVIAIVDTGVDYNHPDLAANIWVNPGEDLNNNSIVDPGPPPEGDFDGNDTDGNGYVDDIRGWNFWADDNDTMDTYGHGTHCAGIAASVTNNSIGVAGVSWNSKIMAVRHNDGIGYMDVATSAKSISYAANNSANIISMSWGFSSNSSTLYNACRQAYDKGVLLVAAAGNSASDVKPYPAGLDEVIAVAATNSADDPAIFTNYGDWVEVSAPGVGILSTFLDDLYSTKSGTSMAAPYVAGVAALIWSRFPNWTRDEVRFQLHNTTDDLGDPSRDYYYGYGRVNARWAVDHSSPEHDLRAWGMEAPQVLKPGNSTTINCTVLNFGRNNESDVQVRLLVNDTVIDNTTIISLASYEWATVNFSWTPTVEGWYNITSYVVPVGGENFTDNNMKSARILVRVEEIVYVPEDYSMIQRAIGAANSGYTVQVATGRYYESLGVTKDVTLLGETSTATIIDCDGDKYVVWVKADNVTISRFAIQNANEWGIYLDHSWGILISDNTISENYRGVCIDNIFRPPKPQLPYANPGGHNISGNTLSNNIYGIHLYFSEDNTIYHNNFINNNVQAYIQGPSYGMPNTWDAGYPAGGNYWSDYTDVDQYSGPYQNQTGGDGIWDHPRNLTLDNQDKYPLVHPWGSIRNVDTDLTYLTIQKAIDVPETSDGHTIEVKPGTYYEHVGVNKSLTLLGEGSDTTIIDGEGSGSIVVVQANNVTISNFKIQNGYLSGIVLYYSNYSSVSSNKVSDCENGIYLYRSLGSSLANNKISNNTYGILLFKSDNNTISETTMSNNYYGLYLKNTHNTLIHHSNFINNTVQVTMHGAQDNTWISTNHVGNYWSNYNGTDNDPYEGIFDDPYVINQHNQDDYPLVWKWFPGDINGDGTVDMDDFVLWQEAFGTQDGDPDYNPIADLNYDGIVDMYDYYIWLQNFGKSGP